MEFDQIIKIIEGQLINAANFIAVPDAGIEHDREKLSIKSKYRKIEALENFWRDLSLKTRSDTPEQIEKKIRDTLDSIVLLLNPPAKESDSEDDEVWDDLEGDMVAFREGGRLRDYLLSWAGGDQAALAFLMKDLIGYSKRLSFLIPREKLEYLQIFPYALKEQDYQCIEGCRERLASALISVKPCTPLERIALRAHSIVINKYYQEYADSVEEGNQVHALSAIEMICGIYDPSKNFSFSTSTMIAPQDSWIIYRNYVQNLNNELVRIKEHDNKAIIDFLRSHPISHKHEDGRKEVLFYDQEGRKYFFIKTGHFRDEEGAEYLLDREEKKYYCTKDVERSYINGLIESPITLLKEYLKTLNVVGPLDDADYSSLMNSDGDNWELNEIKIKEIIENIFLPEVRIEHPFFEEGLPTELNPPAELDSDMMPHYINKRLLYRDPIAIGIDALYFLAVSQAKNSDVQTTYQAKFFQTIINIGCCNLKESEVDESIYDPRKFVTNIINTTINKFRDLMMVRHYASPLHVFKTQYILSVLEAMPQRYAEPIENFIEHNLYVGTVGFLIQKALTEDDKSFVRCAKRHLVEHRGHKFLGDDYLSLRCNYVRSIDRSKIEEGNYELLKWSIKNNHLDILKLLINLESTAIDDVGAGSVDSPAAIDYPASQARKKQDYAISLAIEEGHLDIRQLQSQKVGDLHRLLIVAIESNHAKAVENLLRMKEIDINDDKTLPVFHAIKVALGNPDKATGMTEIIRLLLQNPLIDINKKDENDKTIFEYFNTRNFHSYYIYHRLSPNKRALREFRGNILDLILEHPNFDVNCGYDTIGRSLLELAIADRDPYIAAKLLSSPKIRLRAIDNPRGYGDLTPHDWYSPSGHELDTQKLPSFTIPVNKSLLTIFINGPYAEYGELFFEKFSIYGSLIKSGVIKFQNSDMVDDFNSRCEEVLKPNNGKYRDDRTKELHQKAEEIIMIARKKAGEKKHNLVDKKYKNLMKALTNHLYFYLEDCERVGEVDAEAIGKDISESFVKTTGRHFRLVAGDNFKISNKFFLFAIAKHLPQITLLEDLYKEEEVGGESERKSILVAEGEAKEEEDYDTRFSAASGVMDESPTDHALLRRQASLDLFNQVGARTNLSHQNIHQLLLLAFTDRNFGGVPESEYQKRTMNGRNEVNIITISNDVTDEVFDNDILASIKKFVMNPESQHASFVVGRGCLVGEQIVGNTHWTALSISKVFQDDGGFNIIARHIDSDSIGNSVPAPINRIFNKLQRELIDAGSTINIQCTTVEDSVQQEDGYSCGYHTVFNLVKERLQYEDVSIDRMRSHEYFIDYFREHLQKIFNQHQYTTGYKKYFPGEFETASVLLINDLFQSSLDQTTPAIDKLSHLISKKEAYENLNYDDSMLIQDLYTYVLEACLLEIRNKLKDHDSLEKTINALEKIIAKKGIENLTKIGEVLQGTLLLETAEEIVKNIEDISQYFLADYEDRDIESSESKESKDKLPGNSPSLLLGNSPSPVTPDLGRTP